MSGANFRDLLKFNEDTVSRPQSLAIGHYIGEIKAHKFLISAKKGTPNVTFYLTVIEEASDVPDGANAGIDFSEKLLEAVYWLTPKAKYQLQDMLDAVLGKDTSKRDADERLDDTTGARVMFEIQHEANERNPNLPREVIRNIVAA